MDGKISPEAQKLFIQLQQQEKQLQNMDLQRQSLTYQKMEIDKALEEIKKCDEKEEMFKIVGPVLIKSSKDKLEAELTEIKNNIDKNLKIIGESEKKLEERMTSGQQKLQEMLKGGKPATEAG